MLLLDVLHKINRSNDIKRVIQLTLKVGKSITESHVFQTYCFCRILHRRDIIVHAKNILITAIATGIQE